MTLIINLIKKINRNNIYGITIKFKQVNYKSVN